MPLEEALLIAQISMQEYETASMEKVLFKIKFTEDEGVLTYKVNYD